ncbi:hypothetical protein AWJ19_10255 [Paenibacillus sp. DMB5]|nr:hypothetical protein AWJ19_10255 [Paenibacillus sp. DMB5]
MEIKLQIIKELIEIHHELLIMESIWETEKSYKPTQKNRVEFESIRLRVLNGKSAFFSEEVF